MRAARCGLFIRGGNICIFHPSPSLQANLPNPSSLLSFSLSFRLLESTPGEEAKKGSTSLFLNRSGKEQKDKKEGGPLFRGRPLRDLICMSRCCLLPPSSFLFSPSPGYRWRRKRRKGGEDRSYNWFPFASRATSPSLLL